MSFEDSMLEAGFSDEQDYFDNLFDEYDAEYSSRRVYQEEKEYDYSEEEINEIERERQFVKENRDKYDLWEQANEHEYLLWCENVNHSSGYHDFSYPSHPSGYSGYVSWLNWLEGRKKAKSFIDEIYKDKSQRRKQVEVVLALDVVKDLFGNHFLFVSNYSSYIDDIIRFSHINSDFKEYLRDNICELSLNFAYLSWEIWRQEWPDGHFRTDYEDWKRLFPIISDKFEEKYLDPIRYDIPGDLVNKFHIENNDYYYSANQFIEWLIDNIWFSKYWEGKGTYDDSFEPADSKDYQSDKETRISSWKEWEKENATKIRKDYPIVLLFREWVEEHIEEWHQWAYSNSSIWKYHYDKNRDYKYRSRIYQYDGIIANNEQLKNNLDNEIDYIILQEYLYRITGDEVKFKDCLLVW